MQQIDSVQKIREALKTAKQSGRKISFVPTMGSLHAGHLSLINKARDHGDFRVVSLYVNPTQFNHEEDFKKYPRNTEADLKICKSEGVNLVFLPSTKEIYPQGTQPTNPVPKVGLTMEGEFRPGHFAGVCTVVDRLFSILQPHVALFGEKDFQQFRVIQEMTKNQRHSIQILGYPTIRDKNGLALSSRNKRLTEAGYEEALTLQKMIKAAQYLVQNGETSSAKILQKIKTELKTDYITIADATTLQPIQKIDSNSRIFIAGWVEGIRLIDNAPL